MEVNQKIKDNSRKIAVAGLAVSILAAAAAIQIGSETMKEPEKTQNQKNPTNNTEQTEYHKQINITTGIEPYRTKIGLNQTLRIKNTRQEPVNLSFQTIDKPTTQIPRKNSRTFTPSEYAPLPDVNYFEINNGQTGQLVIKE